MTLTTKTFAYARDQDAAVLDREDRETVIASLVEWFRIWLPASFIDGEDIGDSGVLVGNSRHAGMDLVAWDLLCSEPTSSMHIVVGAFLYGYWSRQSVSDSFPLGTYADALDALATSDKAYPATALALYIALTASVSRLSNDQRPNIRTRLLIARGKLLSHNLFPHALVSLNYLVAPGQSRPILDSGSYHGYRCDDGPLAYLVVERAADGTDVIRVHDVVLHDRKLEVQYEMCDEDHTDADAPDLIAACILSTLLDDRFRGQADSVDYINIKTEATLTLPYALDS